MTDDRFDDLTRVLGRASTRRGVFKGLIAAAVGGVLARAGGGDAAARARVKMACSRLRQPCSTAKGTPGSLICCPHLACDSDHTCCTPTNVSCLDDGQCCAGDICRPNPHGLGNRCLPPGAVGAQCVEDTDCAGGLACDPTGVCLSVLGNPCHSDDDCGSGFCDPYTLVCVACQTAGVTCIANSDCCSGICDDYIGACASGCLVDGAGCAESSDCCSGYCDPYSQTCTQHCTATGYICSANAECCSAICDDYTGLCIGSCLAYGVACAESADCCAGLTCVGNVCLTNNGGPCLDDPECASGVCDEYTGLCIGSCLAFGSHCAETNDCCSGLTCVGSVCLTQDGAPCADDPECASGICDEYTGLCIGSCLALNSQCAESGDCCTGLACAGNVCLTSDGGICTDDPQCVSGLCDEYTGTCIGQCLALGSGCAESGDCCSGLACSNGQCLTINGLACTNSTTCASGLCQTTGVCGVVAAQCVTGPDPEFGTQWVVCRADANSTWVSMAQGNGGQFHAEQICHLLGYTQFAQHGGTTLGVCTSDGSSVATCSAPGPENYDNRPSNLDTPDEFGVIISNSVMWECLA
jgi:hypothetical protein